MTALTNTLVLVVGLAAGTVEPSSISLGLLGWGIVLFVHRRNGWPPFRRASGHRPGSAGDRQRS